jgi:hypothetical protein
MKYKRGSFQVKYILISFALFMTACSNAEVYEAVRHSDKYHCESIPNAQDRIRCQEAPRKSYEEYQQYLEEQK